MTYSHVLKGWREFFGSLAKALEILAVYEGVKPVARLLIFHGDAQKTGLFLESLPLAVVRADFAVDLWTGTTGYSSKGEMIPLDSGQGHQVFYIARRVDEAQQAKDAEARQDHIALGRLLGYPACCSRFFREYEASERARHNTFIAPLLAHSRQLSAKEAYPLGNDIFLRPADICLLSHVPCGLDCRNSQAIADRMIALLHKYSGKTELLFRERLASDLIVGEAGDIIALEGVVAVTERTVRFERAIAPRPTPILDELNRVKQFETIPRKGILIGGSKLVPDVWFVRFR